MWKLSLLPSRSQVVSLSSFSLCLLSLSLSFMLCTMPWESRKRGKIETIAVIAGSQRAAALSERTQWYRRIREIRVERIARRSKQDSLPYLVACGTYIDSLRIRLEFTRTLCCAWIVVGHTPYHKKRRKRNTTAPRKFLTIKNFYLAKQIKLLKSFCQLL